MISCNMKMPYNAHYISVGHRFHVTRKKVLLLSNTINRQLKMRPMSCKSPSGCETGTDSTWRQVHGEWSVAINVDVSVIDVLNGGQVGNECWPW